MKAQLVKIDVAAAESGWSVKELFTLAEGSTLTEKGLAWVFDMANDLAAANSKGGSHRRDLRFWLPEIQARTSKDTSIQSKYNFWQLSWVLNKILPEKREHFHAGEVDALFQIRPRTRIDFNELNGGIQGGRNFYSREALVKFLTTRWLGNEKLINAGRQPVS